MVVAHLILSLTIELQGPGELALPHCDVQGCTQNE